LPEALEQLPFPPLHGLRLTLIRVVVVQQMQHAVDHQQRELVVERARVLGRLALRHRRADDDVPRTTGESLGSVGEPGPRPPTSGWRPLAT